MQSSLAYGIAKNVNPRPGARRAASAYHLGGRHISPSPSSSSLSTLAEPPPSSSDGQEFGGSPTLLALSAAVQHPLKSSASAMSLSAMLNGDGKGLGYGDDQANAVPGDLVHHTRATDDQEHDRYHLPQRKGSVDKKNPFIGYFQSANRPQSVASSPASSPTVAVAAASTNAFRDGLLGSYQYSSVILNQSKRLTEWIGAQSNRLPAIFAKRDEKKTSGKPPRPTSVRADAGEEVEGVPVALFDDYTIEAVATASDDEQEADPVQTTNASGIDQLVKAAQHEEALAQRSASSLSSLTLNGTSRFEQDFEILSTLGEGGQGTVYKVRSCIDGCVYAVKKVLLPSGQLRDSDGVRQALREVKAMAAMSPHPNVVRYHTAWLEEEIVDRSPPPSPIVKPSSSDERENSVASSVYSEDSYSFNSLSNFEGSFGGFQFAESSRSRSIVAEAEAELMKSKPLRRVLEVESEDGSSESSASKSSVQLVLYIQMELCGSAAISSSPVEDESEDEEADSFQRLINRVTRKKAPKPVVEAEVVHTTLTSWLRSTVDERGSADVNLVKHREGLKLFLGAVEGVQHMHAAGVIHRDLKPDNIFIHGDVAKIGDFGLSKSIVGDSRDSPLTTFAVNTDDHTTALGTFTYASPEQLGYTWNRANGKASNIVKSAKYSIQSDIFALGIILLELCYPCSTMMERSQVLTAVRHGVVPQSALQQFPDEMALVLRMTATDPAERPTTEEIAECIRSLTASPETLNVRVALDELRDLQQKLTMAVMQLRDRSQATQQLESLVAELSDKVQNVGLAIA